MIEKHIPTPDLQRRNRVMRYNSACEDRYGILAHYLTVNGVFHMKFKLFIALLCVFGGAYLVWGIDIAMGIGLASLGLFSLADILITKRAKRYKLTAIHGTFRADIEGNDLEKVKQELNHAVKSWPIYDQNTT